MKIIINADDFGLTQPVNQAIFELASFGTLSSTTVMVNMPFAEEISQLIKNKSFGIGLHFNLTQGKPLSNALDIGSIVNENGNFFPVNELKRKIKAGKVEPNHVLQELQEQYKWLFEKVGDRLTHIDSHQEINKLNFIMDILMKFTQMLTYKHGLRVYNKSYLSVNKGVPHLTNPGILNVSRFGFRRSLVESYFRFKNLSLGKYYQIPNGMLLTKDNSTRGLLKTLLLLDSTDFDKNCYEIMCHPAKSVEGLTETKMLQSRVEEYEILKSEPFKTFTKNARLINFSQISN